MGFISCLTLLLVAAKLFGYAHYGWLAALSPMLGSLALAFVVALIGATVHVVNERGERKRLEEIYATHQRNMKKLGY